MDAARYERFSFHSSKHLNSSSQKTQIRKAIKIWWCWWWKVKPCFVYDNRVGRTSEPNWWWYFFFGLEGFWGQPPRRNFPSPRALMLALLLDCFTPALTTPQKVLSIWRLVELKMLDFSDPTRTGISILTSAADSWWWYLSGLFLSCQTAAFGISMGPGDRAVKSHPMVPTAWPLNRAWSHF